MLSLSSQMFLTEPESHCPPTPACARLPPVMTPSAGRTEVATLLTFWLVQSLSVQKMSRSQARIYRLCSAAVDFCRHSRGGVNQVCCLVRDAYVCPHQAEAAAPDGSGNRDSGVCGGNVSGQVTWVQDLPLTSSNSTSDTPN